MSDIDKDGMTASPGEKPLPYGELKMLALLFIVGAALFADSLRSEGFFQGASKGPGSIPQLVSGALVVLVAGQAFSLLRKGYKEGSFADLSRYLFDKDVVILLVCICVYGLAVEAVGFVPSTFLFLVTAMYSLDRKQLARKMLISAGTVATLALIFSTLFQVVLP